MFLDDVPINYWGVLSAAIIYFIIGCIWYSPFLFGRQASRHIEDLETINEIHPIRKVSSYIGEFIISLIIAYILALFIQISLADEYIEAITVAFWIWLGFIATTHFSAVLWSRKTAKHFLIHAGFMLVGFLAMAVTIMYFGL